MACNIRCRTVLLLKIAQGTRSSATDQPVESCPYETCFRAQGQEIRLGVLALGQLVNGFTDRSRSRHNEWPITRHIQLKSRSRKRTLAQAAPRPIVGPGVALLSARGRLRV
ncbi:hypothetical protein PAAG_11058 [Paracoccidioides lutzii Pb01]|uniref:Uncharacterized protein n=1 Tax=Paracoccidioides lutzii (strain ATCC MYA-826 / Pb01) TaxID=502779 RepID=A0A0A2VMQ0_PARBA|nr:hypothetical protein PAAG_11058 [Paracoccidioides lutzii Pb01]KGQ02109.1 hypothetical protein PAAG_11058 [Paracoccidioides lutzii Pb01]